MRCTNPLGAPDVMRGEETQLLGALRLGNLAGAGRQLVCMPGTHTKWVSVSGGVVQEFLTAPTGEIFAMLCDHSVLVRDKATPITHVAPDFERGLAEAVRHPGAFVHQIFQARSLRLDKQLSAEGAASWTSGLLIGADVGGALTMFGEENNAPVLIIGDDHASPRATRWRWRAAAARPCRSTVRRPHSPGWLISSRSGSAHDDQELWKWSPSCAGSRHNARPRSARRCSTPGSAASKCRSIPRIRSIPSNYSRPRMAHSAWSAPAPCSARRKSSACMARAAGSWSRPTAIPFVIRRALELGMRVLPGIATATEAFTALAAGATELKLFPAATYGPRHLKALKSVLPKHVRVFPVGGIGSQDIAEWLCQAPTDSDSAANCSRPRIHSRS